MKQRLLHTKPNEDIASLMSVCCGNPRGDELPQVASEEDIVLDICSDVLNMSRDHAAGVVHHQYDDGLDYADMIH